MENNKRSRHEPKTFIGRFMVYTFIPQYANNVMGLVYIGAAILIIIVGLRGLGASVANNPMVPQFLIGENGRIMIFWVMIALYLEFCLLFILAFVTFFTPEGEVHGKDEKGSVAHGVENIQLEQAAANASKLREQVEVLKRLADDEMRMIEGYLDKFAGISEKITKIQMQNLDSLAQMKETLKK